MGSGIFEAKEYMLMLDVTLMYKEKDMTPPDSPPGSQPGSAAGLERLRNAAQAAHMELLDEDWRGWSARYRLRCTAGHVWSRNMMQIVHCRKLVCPECWDSEQLTRLAAAVGQHGSICLDTRWRGYSAKYHFRCAAGHLWERLAKNVLSNNSTICLQCRSEIGRPKGRLADGLEQLRAAAAAKGGQLLDDHYDGVHTQYRFRCRQGHEWTTHGSEVLRGYWCKLCGYKEGGRARRDAEGLARLHAAAAAKGGVCLSQTYTVQNAYYRFRCAKGHEWEVLGSSVILGGKWCVRCLNDARRNNIEIFQEIAAQRGGQCLSQVYHNNKTKLTWMCHKGHVWEALPNSIKRGNWCPQCYYASKITRPDSPARMRYSDSPR